MKGARAGTDTVTSVDQTPQGYVTSCRETKQLLFRLQSKNDASKWEIHQWKRRTGAVISEESALSGQSFLDNFCRMLALTAECKRLVGLPLPNHVRHFDRYMECGAHHPKSQHYW
jgi:hypothetical protein